MVKQQRGDHSRQLVSRRGGALGLTQFGFEASQHLPQRIFASLQPKGCQPQCSRQPTGYLSRPRFEHLAAAHPVVWT